MKYKCWNNCKKSVIWLDKGTDICYTKNDVWIPIITFRGGLC